MISLGIDAGGSSTRWLLLDENGIVASAKTESFSGLFYTTEEKTKNLKTLKALIDDVLKKAKPDIVVAGVSGFSPGETEAAIKNLLRNSLQISSENIIIKNDMYIAYRNAFDLGEGILIYGGTGSIAYYIDNKKTLQAGGRGYLIDDAGGGFWIGKEALKHIFRQEDELGKPPNTELAKEIYEDLGTKEWPEIKNLIYGGGRKRLASLSFAVANAASKDDEKAKDILQRAGLELARLANALQSRVGGEKPVAFAGGISKVHPILTKSLKNALRDNLDFWIVETQAVEAAARLGLDLLKKQL